MFILHVSEELQSWPESEERVREWVPLTEAVRRCRYPWMREALERWVRAKGWPPLDASCGKQQATPQLWTVGTRIGGERACSSQESIPLAM